MSPGPCCCIASWPAVSAWPTSTVLRRACSCRTLYLGCPRSPSASPQRALSPFLSLSAHSALLW
eukprot:3062667-Rhodomonas_salina.1